METQTPVKKPSLVDQMNEYAELHTQPVQVKVEPTAAQVREAMEIIRSQPGRPTREIMIKRCMMEKGLTRAQAKDMVKRFDAEMVQQYLAEKAKNERHETVVGLGNVKPLTTAIFRGMGYSV